MPTKAEFNGTEAEGFVLMQGTRPNPVPIERWGKDHWGMLLYAESRAVDNKGMIDNRHMRCRHASHPEFSHGGLEHDGGKYPTILKDGVRLFDHDDWDCLTDIAAADLIEVRWNEDAPGQAFVWLTYKGWKLAGMLRRNRANGSTDAKFRYTP